MTDLINVSILGLVEKKYKNFQTQCQHDHHHIVLRQFLTYICMCKRHSLPLMQSFRGRCFDVMTCNELWICAILTTGCPGI